MTSRLCVVVAMLVALAMTEPEAGAATVQGELKRWHRIELRFSGPSRTESDNSPNPFLDYRLQCSLRAPSGRTFDVPGFFDTDAAGGSTGSIWVCRFSAGETGSWTYTASFRAGADVAISTSATAGAPTSFDGDTGSFTVAESDKSEPDFRSAELGRLRNPGGHYLKFAGSGRLWIKGGTNIPENLLGYTGFDNTPDAGHSFAVHASDWKAGDPDWGGGKGKAIVGALNWLAAAGANSIYFLPMNVGGDGDDTFPTLNPTDKTHYDTSKLRQWETVFTHADKLGIFLHVQLSEKDAANATYHDGGELGTTRKLFYRELVARFGHHLGLEWDLGEENDYGTQRRKAFAAHIAALDPYDHPITNHTKLNATESTYAPLLGDGNFSMTAFQASPAVVQEFASWRERSADAGKPWVISFDEPQRIENDANDQTSGYPSGRRNFLWPAYLSGGGGFEWYVQEDGGGHGFDQRIDDFHPLASALAWTRHARTFSSTLPLASMSPRPELGDAQFTLANVGVVYALYDSQGGSLSLDLPGSGAFEVQWFDPRTGAWHTGASVTGGGRRNLGAPPFSGDAAAVVRAAGVGSSTTTTSSTLPLIGECPSEPLNTCRHASGGQIKLVHQESGGARFVWKWLSPASTNPDTWGAPDFETTYSVCVFDARTGGYERAIEMNFPSGARWSERKYGGYAYRDSEGRHSGLHAGLLKSTPGGATKIFAKAAGEHFPAPPPVETDRWFQQAPDVVVQILNSDGLCWETTFPVTSTTENDGTAFKAKGG